MYVNMIGHDLGEVAWKEVVLGHEIFAIIPGSIRLVLQLRNLCEWNRVPYVGVLVEKNRLIVQIGGTGCVFVGAAKMIVFLETL